MKSVISTTYDDKYLYFLPIVTWCWNKLGVDVICFMPKDVDNSARDKILLMLKHSVEWPPRLRMEFFDAPKHKEATYAQVSRLYAASLDLPEDEVLITSDIDMALFKVPTYGGTGMGVVGIDLVPKKQVPMCYIYGDVKEWRKKFETNGRTYQQCLDDLLEGIECENMRGNYWGKDQEEAYNKIFANNGHAVLIPRSNGQNQFAQNRVDRDDTNWRSYVNDELIDAHLWRPGYTEENFPKILELLQTKYPNDNFDWLVEYTNAYKQLL